MQKHWLWAGLLCASLSANASALTLKKMFVWVPQTDESIEAVVKRLESHPSLRIVMALSPRFLHAAKEDGLRQRIQELEGQHRLAIALQIPNAPLLPLLLDTQQAADALPAGSPLPQPAYAGPEDVLQHIAAARVAMTKVWGSSPKGLVFPYGATSAGLLRFLDRQGFPWAVAALGVGPSSGPFRLEGFFSSTATPIWDGAQPVTSEASLQVIVADDREAKLLLSAAHLMDTWDRELTLDHVTAVLPDDADNPAPLAIDEKRVRIRTWTHPDLSTWIGAPEKNALWVVLAKTRQALDQYKNSGRAQLSRLDAAWDEFLTAENARFLAMAGDSTLPDVVREDRERDFQASINSVYRLLGEAPPEDLFTAAAAATALPEQEQPVHYSTDLLKNGQERVRFQRMNISTKTLMLADFEVSASSVALDWRLVLSTPVAGLVSGVNGPTVDIYLDVNGLPGVGTLSYLPGREGSARAEDAWEYAIQVTPTSATLFRTQNGGIADYVGVNATAVGREISFTVPHSIVRGSPRRWGYTILVLDPHMHTVDRLAHRAP